MTEIAARSASQRWLVVALCMVAYIFSYVDRLILSLLIGPIRADLGISDTAFGLLTGLAFALFYSILGVPIATLADRTSRPLVISTGIVVWSIATVVCGLARSYPELFAARVAVGIGEAALAPAVYSLLADLFPKERLGRALSAFSVGIFVGSGLAFLVGGAAIAALSRGGDWAVLGIVLKPWQACFVFVGAPGILVALLVVAFVKEPFPGGIRPKPVGGDASFAQVLAFLWETRAIFIPHMLGFTLLAMSVFSFLSWAPAYLMRTFGLTPQSSGIWLGALTITAGTAGVLSSGWLMDRWVVAGRGDAPFRVGILGAVCTALAAILLPFAGTLAVAAPILAVLIFFNSFPIPTSTAVMQLVPPARMRSRVSALFLLSNSVGGLALGSALVGVLNDRVFRETSGVASSMSVVVACASILGAAVLLGARAPYSRRTSVIRAPA